MIGLLQNDVRLDRSSGLRQSRFEFGSSGDLIFYGPLPERSSRNVSLSQLQLRFHSPRERARPPAPRRSRHHPPAMSIAEMMIAASAVMPNAAAAVMPATSIR